MKQLGILLCDQFKKGGPIRQYPAAWFNKVARILNTITVVNLAGDEIGRVLKESSGRSWKILIDVAGEFNGQAYTPAGILYEDLTDPTKPWVLYDLSTGVITEQIGPSATPWGAHESWRKKSDFSGAIYF